MNSENEIQLIKSCISGNRKYQEILYQKFCRKMMGICFRYSRNREEAEDFLQEAFIKVFLNLHQYKYKGSLEGWIRKIVLNTIFENLRKKSLMFPVAEIDENIPASEPEQFPDGISIEDLVQLIQQLSPGYRTVFNLYAIEGFTHREIAARLGISEGTSKSQYAGARKILREKIGNLRKESTVSP